MNPEDLKEFLPSKNKMKRLLLNPMELCRAVVELGPEMGSGFDCEVYPHEVIISHLFFPPVPLDYRLCRLM